MASEVVPQIFLILLASAFPSFDLQAISRYILQFFVEANLGLKLIGRTLEDGLLKKINQILDNPSIGDPKCHQLKHSRGSHVNPYVIVYVLDGDKITFLYVDHHNFVYAKQLKSSEDGKERLRMLNSQFILLFIPSKEAQIVSALDSHKIGVSQESMAVI